ncbi:L-serine ammonia-lyase [Komagataeibacter melomenusus]
MTAQPETTAITKNHSTITDTLSITDLYTIGIGPSSSHTVGPMRAAYDFATWAASHGQPCRLSCQLFGSLALTGEGHGTDTAVILGLLGWQPETVDPDRVPLHLEDVRRNGTLLLDGKMPVPFDMHADIHFLRERFHPDHPNTLQFSATFADGTVIGQVYHSIGGGTIIKPGTPPPRAMHVLPYPFHSGTDMLETCKRTGLALWEVMMANEAAFRPEAETVRFVDSVSTAMSNCIEKGCQTNGTLPGKLKVRRRAHQIFSALRHKNRVDMQSMFEWVSLWALAVSEENAAGGRIVTAPTNGASGVIPAVLRYYERFTPSPTPLGVRKILLTAGAICILYKKKASISAAEMGCQGEVGVACSMAAAGLCAALGGTIEQIENAAEIGMEHNLGLTCDPIGGLVQIPCIERNTMGAIKAINAAYLALCGDGTHFVSLDAVIETMRQTGCDMAAQYKETSLGGLAVNVVEC